MGRDVPDGVLSLDRRGDLTLNWDKRGSTGFFDHAIAVSKGMADALEGRFVLNPVTSLFNRFVTVHPLGGCAMGATSAEGVIDVWGRVHGHPHLHVVDGAALPGPVGANPSLTIAALANRFADQLLDDLAARPHHPPTPQP
jgi:cholesterol oxidase